MISKKSYSTFQGIYFDLTGEVINEWLHNAKNHKNVVSIYQNIHWSGNFLCKQKNL